jgi:hypothetical protein
MTVYSLLNDDPILPVTASLECTSIKDAVEAVTGSIASALREE